MKVDEGAKPGCRLVFCALGSALEKVAIVMVLRSLCICVVLASYPKCTSPMPALHQTRILHVQRSPSTVPVLHYCGTCVSPMCSAAPVLYWCSTLCSITEAPAKSTGVVPVACAQDICPARRPYPFLSADHASAQWSGGVLSMSVASFGSPGFFANLDTMHRGWQAIG